VQKKCYLYVSTRLPCQHLYSVLVTCVSDRTFQVAHLHPRWSMNEAKIVIPNVESTVQHLRKDSRTTGDSRHAASVGIRFAAKSRIAYVKLKKGEVSEHTAVSDCEKYNVVRAEVMPLVDAQQLLPNHKFYKTFADLRARIEAFKTKWDLEKSAPREASDDGDSDCDLADLELEEPVATEGADVCSTSEWPT
ncbi:hypothetical protein JG688_00010769, partial [Phytophthora aleatoria]